VKKYYLPHIDWRRWLTLIGGPNCQMNLNYIVASSPVYLYNLNTYGSEYMYTSNETYSKANENLNTFCSSCIVDLDLFK
jgi:hypothetical protein